MTQVTILLADDPTWGGVLRGMLVVAALLWAWSVYAWLTSAVDVDEGGVRLLMLASMAAMFGVALAVLLPLVPAALAVPALAALALVSAACTFVVAYEVFRYRAACLEVRHPELAA